MSNLPDQLYSVSVKSVGAAGSVVVYYDRYPDTCPLCHKAIEATLLSAGLRGSATGGRLQLAFQCPRHGCASLFIATYKWTLASASKPKGHFELDFVAPMTPVKTAFSTQIAKVSLNFVTIYNQALAAESFQLDQLTGIGLRKALEFLVKDFAIHEHKEKEAEIRGMLLGACIQEYVKDPNVQTTAERAAWLGNDETHYIRKWETKDINDLKVLVRLTTNWIENVLLTQEYAKEMPDTRNAR